jgi:hypothetical protein
LAPSTEKLCPTEPEVALKELGLNPNSQLFIVPSNDETRTLWNLLGSDQVLRPFKHTTFIGNPDSFRGISPNRHWFAFYTKNNSGSYELWISSVGGDQQWIARKNLDRPYLTSWVTDKEMIVFDRQRGDLGPTTAFRLDPFSGDLIPMDQIYLEWNIYAFSPDTQQVIYLDGMPLSWNLYDFTTSETRRVFPWASGRATRFYDLAVHWGSSGVSIAIFGDAGLDLALALPPNSFGNNDVPKFHLPVGNGRAWYVDWWSADSQKVLLTYGFDDTSVETSSLSTNFLYLLDATRQKLYDLCLPTENLSIDVSSTYSSADERFLAWPTTKGNAFGTIVWEIATGRYAWIPDVKVIGWAELNGDVTTP